MSKVAKRLLAALLAIALLVGGLWGVLVLIRNLRRKPVKVFSVANFATNDMYGTQSETSGMVTSEDLQKIWPTDTQIIRKVFVSEGQRVKKGDPLLSYDTTLSEIDLERARLAVAKAAALAVIAASVFARFTVLRTGRVLYFFGCGTGSRGFSGSKFSAFFGKLVHHYLRLK